MFQIRVKVLYNKRVKKNYFHLLFPAPEIAKEAMPGQFIQIRLNNHAGPFLRRPFSIHRLKDKNTEILYAVLGKGTQILSQRKKGEYLDIIGPLGKGFNYQLPIILRQAQDASLKDTERSRSANHQSPILVAGGMGVAPLIFLAEKLAERKTLKQAKCKTLALIGAKTKSDILCTDEFRKLSCEVKIATDNGSQGFKGKVTDLLKHLLSTVDYRLSTIYACGPAIMLKEISELSKKYDIPAQISLEEHLACGIGACLGCVVDTKDGYQRVCKEGPVFAAGEIIWRKE